MESYKHSLEGVDVVSVDLVCIGAVGGEVGDGVEVHVVRGLVYRELAGAALGLRANAGV